MAHYRVEVTQHGALKPYTLNFSNREEAMESWDNAVDEALGGDFLRLLDLETGRVMSTYAPVRREVL